MKKIQLYRDLLIFLGIIGMMTMNPSKVWAQCGSISNGEMNGDINQQIQGWTIIAGHAEIKAPRALSHVGPSPQGAKLLALFSMKTRSAEIKTQITGLQPGSTYTLVWYSAIEKDLFSQPENTTAYLVQIGQKKVWNSVRTASWSTESLVFNAASNTETLRISLPKSSHVLLDGLSISCGGSLNACPSMEQGLMSGNIDKEPHGWTVYVKSARLISNKKLPKVGPSPVGGAVLMLKEHNQPNYTAETELYGLVPGDTYSLNWYSSVEPGLMGSFNTQANYTLQLEGISNTFQTGNLLWKQESISFTASSTETMLKIKFKGRGNTTARMLLDGMSLTCSNPCDLIIPTYSKN